MSNMSRDENLRELGDWFDRLARLLEREGFLGHLNLNIEIEYFFRDVLNAMHDWNLDNRNDLFGKNAESIDLSSTTRRIAVQVTTTQTAAKIRDTLKKFLPKLGSQYDRLIFIYPALTKSKTNAPFEKQLDGFDFNAFRDRWDLSDLLTKAQSLEIGKQNALVELVRQELRPLGTALQMGVEPSVEALIKVISYMVSASTPTTVSDYNPPANLQAKLNRFHEHAEFLKRNFILNRHFYIPVEEARKAVGYDAANVPRIRLWLIQNSLSKLDLYEGNAKAAFESLTEQLMDAVKTSGNDSDRTAVSYLLADEFFRCNVFPNSEELQNITHS